MVISAYVASPGFDLGNPGAPSVKHYIRCRVQPCGTVSPGASIGTLTFNNDLTLAGTTIMELNKDSGLTNDLINANGNLSYGGTLKVVLTGSTALTTNHTFKLFTLPVLSTEPQRFYRLQVQ